MDQLKKATEKLNLGHALLAPVVIAARMYHQIPIFLENTLQSRDVSRPTLRSKSHKCRPSDVTFDDDNWLSYQCIGWEFTKEYFDSMTQMIPTRLRNWSLESFNKSDTCMIVRIDRDHPVYTEDRSLQYKSIVNWLHKTQPIQFLGPYSHVTILVPDHSLVMGLLDHYSCDGSILFNYFINVLDVKDIQPPPPLPKYQYIPFLTDMYTTECVMRTAYNIMKRPSQITTFGKELVGSRNILHKSQTKYWSRWGNYGECILRVFERLEGIRTDLGEMLYGTQQIPIITRAVPTHLNICLTAGIKTDCMFGNNRLGCIFVQVDRPEPTKSRDERLLSIMTQFETQCTENFTDAMSSYDFVRGFDTGKIREYFSSNVFDIMFTSFRVNECPDTMTGGFGGFIGQYDAPYMYINSMTTKDRSLVSYTTNWW